MVKLNRIYTRTGDDGTTGLATGQRVRKDHPRILAYGAVDEANSALGVCITHALAANGPAAAIAPILQSIQHDMFDLGADLATPINPAEPPAKRLRILPAQTARLESLIDQHNDRLAPLASFVLPGGTPLAASLHVARTVTRRAEQLAVALRALNESETSPDAITYLNRLSDLLFVLARVANDDGKADILWKPGANR